MHKQVHIHLQQYVQKIPDIQTGYDAFASLKEVAVGIGLERFIVFDITTLGQASLAQRSIVSSLEPDLLRSFDEQNAISGSPLIRLLRGSSRPVHIDVERDEERRGDAVGTFGLELGMFRDYDIRKGIVFPAHVGHGFHGAVCFMGEEIRIDADTQNCTHAYCLYFYEHLAKTIQPGGARDYKISNRQMDCMRWIAEGKTSAEIAKLLTISEHTVNHHIGNVCSKLGAVSRTQAIAKMAQLDML